MGFGTSAVEALDMMRSSSSANDGARTTNIGRALRFLWAGRGDPDTVHGKVRLHLPVTAIGSLAHSANPQDLRDARVL
jgi:hypothetical protein